MSRLRTFIRKLERKDDDVVLVKQHDGPPLKFRQEDVKAAFLNLCERQAGGLNSPDLPPEHPFLAAVRNSPDPVWAGSFYNCEIGDEPPEDLSEK